MMANMYRGAAIEERIRDLRCELDAMPRWSVLRRALVSPATRHELHAVEAKIGTALEAPPSLDVVTTLEGAVPRLAALLSRAEEEIRRAKARERTFPAPSPPGPYYLFRKRTFSLARRCPELLPGAKPHGTGMLLELEHDGARLSLVAHGVRLYGPFVVKKAVECLLRTAAPRGPAFTLEPRGVARRLVSPRDAIAIAPDLDGAMLVRGQAEVARAVLDAPLRAQLLAMRRALRVLFVGDGLVDLAWTQPLPNPREAFPREAELAIATSIAKRLYDASLQARRMME